MEDTASLGEITSPDLLELREAIRESGLFDQQWYLSKYSDVGLSGIDPISHYILIGARLGRDPSPDFYAKGYLEDNPEVKKTGMQALQHYLTFGRTERRQVSSVPVHASRSQDVRHVAKDTPPQSNLGTHQPLDTAVIISGESEKKPGFRYRVLRYAEAFRAVGFTTEVVSCEQIKKHLGEISRARLLVIWRSRWSPEIKAAIEAAKANGAVTVYDLDDLMVRPELAVPEVIDAIRFGKKNASAVARHYEEVRRAMLACDIGTASTAELAWQMRRVDRRRAVFVHPNGFDEATYTSSRLAVRARQTNRDGLIRLGYASGSRTHQADFRVCSGAVSEALRNDSSFRLVLFSRAGVPQLDTEEFPELLDVADQIEWRDFVPHAYLPSEIARFDINLAPLEVNNPFCEAKSELKYFEAAIADVPTIASPTGPMKRAIDHGKTGFLASSPAEWRAAIQALADREFRDSVGRAAHRSALWPFGPKKRAELAHFLSEHIAGGRRASRAFQAMNLEEHRSTPEVPLADRRLLFNQSGLHTSRVTVVIPLYNYESFVIEALESVRAQTLEHIDLVVVDDASTDNSCSAALSWMKENQSRFNRLVLVQHLENSGLGASRNTAFDVADTLHCMALDADNLLRPNCCAILLEAIDNSAAAFAYSTIQRFGSQSGVMGNRPFKSAYWVPENGIDAMAMVSKEAWALVGGYATHRMGWQDYDFWCRIADRGLIGAHVADILAEYRVHDSSMLRTATDKSANKSALIAWMEEEHPWLDLVTPERDVVKSHAAKGKLSRAPLQET